MNTYTLEEGRQRELKAAGAEGKKGLKGIKFFYNRTYAKTLYIVSTDLGDRYNF
ncbi:MAG: hypothetical protein F6K39_12735 [Okeania sp. SIO3B3]|nr:hypothetical protein [Okeania sp. SIO3B3]